MTKNAPEASLQDVRDMLDRLDSLYENRPPKITPDASEDYWRGAKDAREYLFSRIRGVLDGEGR